MLREALPCNAGSGEQACEQKMVDLLQAIKDLPAAMFATLSNTAVTDFIKTTGDYQKAYETARGTYLAAAKALKEQTGPYKASRDAYVAATATYTKSLYE